MNIFIAFANQDRDVRDKLLRQLNLVKDRQGWNIWSAKEIKAGERWGEEIERRLLDSEVIVLLLSADFFSSDYIMDKELPKVVEKHKKGDCQIIPVIARQCHWKDTPFGEYAELGDIQALPVGEKPIMSKGLWDNEDEPYFEVVKGIKDSIRAFRELIAAQQLALHEAAETKTAVALKQEQLRQRYASASMEREEQGRLKKEEEARIQREAEAAHQRQASAFQKTYSRTAPNLYRSNPLLTKVLWLLILCFLGLAIWRGIEKCSSEPKLSVPNTRDQLSESSTTAITRKSGLEMVAVEGGTFQMGSPASEKGRFDNECQHKVPVKAFSIGKYEVTQANWREVMGSDPPELNFKGCDDCPVESVSWAEVQTFIQALNRKKIGGTTYRLPTEEEWEYAARGGNKTKGYIYSGSNDLGRVAWYWDNANKKTHAVGGKAPNELGLYDMSGNVLEWCQDTWKPYPSCVATADGSHRVIRGGGWGNIPSGCRSAHRDRYEQTFTNSDHGFRLAASSF